MKTKRNMLTVVMVMAAMGLAAGAANAAIIVDASKIQSGSATGTLVAIDVPYAPTYPQAGGPDWTGFATADPADNGFTTRMQSIRERYQHSPWEPDGTPYSEAYDQGTYPTVTPNVSYNFNLAASGIDIPDGAIINGVYATWTPRGGGDGATYAYSEGAASGLLAQTHTVNPAGNLVLSWTDDVAVTRNGNFQRLFAGPIIVAGGDGFELTAIDNLGNAAHIDAVVLDVTFPVPEPTIAPITSLSGSNGGDQYANGMGSMINGSGMNKPDPADPSTWTFNGNHYNTEWMGWFFPTPAINNKLAWASFDLGASTPLQDLYLFNNNYQSGISGVNQYNLYTADSPTVALPAQPPKNQFSVTGLTPQGDYDFSSGGWTKFNSSPLNATKAGSDVVDLSGISARYIALEILSNHGDTYKGGRVGLEEVAVMAAPAGGAIPEPATMCALGMAIAGLGGYVRRRRKA